MKLKNKNGFITIYVIISMMFFIIFVMSALIIASRKLKLQAETNESLYNIFNSDVKNIVSDSDEVFVYNKEQFVEIMKWFYEDDPEERSFYINNIVYTLENDKKDDYKLVLKDDIYLSGVEAINYEETDEEIAEVIKEYVPSDEYLGLEEENEEFDELIESFLDEENNRLNMEDFHIYLQVKDEEENINLYPYKWEVIKITTPEEFMKIATGEYIGTYRAIPTATYDIVKDINLEKYFYEPDEEDEQQKKEIFNLLTNRPVFSGVLYSSNNSTLDIKNFNITDEIREDEENIEELTTGLFKTNNGVIQNLDINTVNIDIDPSYDYSNILNIGAIAGINNGLIRNISISNTLLPDEYQQVEYIESTGTQYIDTGVIGSNSIYFEMNVAFTDLSGHANGIAGYQTNTRIAIGVDTNYYFGIGKNNLYLNKADKEFHKLYIDVPTKTYGVDNYSTNTTTTYSNPLNITIKLAGRSNNEKVCDFIKEKIKNVLIKDSNKIIRNFIPCYRKSDNQAGLYDMVNGVFYTNQGDGEFNIGPIIKETNFAAIVGVNNGTIILGEEFDDIENLNGYVAQNFGIIKKYEDGEEIIIEDNSNL